MTTLTEAQRHEWEQPGTFEVAPGVHRIPLPLPNDGLKAVNVYAITDGTAGDLVLIDAGWALAESEELLETGLRSLGRELGDVGQFFVTHLHRDHYTQAITLRRRFGGRVAVGEGEEECLRMIQSARRNPDADRMRVAGAVELAAKIDSWSLGGDHEAEWRDQWEDPDRWLPNGVDLPLTTRTLRVIETPGHTRGHVVYHDAEHDVLFAGDHVLPHITPSIGVEFNRPPVAAPGLSGLAGAGPRDARRPAAARARSGDRVRPRPGRRAARPSRGPAHRDRRGGRRGRGRRRRGGEGRSPGHAASDASTTWTPGIRSSPSTRTVAHLRVLVERDWLTERTVDGVEHFARV